MLSWRPVISLLQVSEGAHGLVLSYPGAMPRVRVAAAQINTVVGDLEGNVEGNLEAKEQIILRGSAIVHPGHVSRMNRSPTKCSPNHSRSCVSGKSLGSQSLTLFSIRCIDIRAPRSANGVRKKMTHSTSTAMLPNRQNPMPRRGRGESSVPAALRALGSGPARA